MMKHQMILMITFQIMIMMTDYDYGERWIWRKCDVICTDWVTDFAYGVPEVIFHIANFTFY